MARSSEAGSPLTRPTHRSGRSARDPATTGRGGSEWRRATSSFRFPGSRFWLRLAACIAVALGPLAVALLTEGGSLDPVSRTLVVVAVGAAVAAGAVLLLRRSARGGNSEDARDRALRLARDQQ